MIKRISELKKYSLSFRMIVNGKIVHMRHIEVKCQDNRGFVLSDKNGDPEYFGGIIITE